LAKALHVETEQPPMVRSGSSKVRRMTKIRKSGKSKHQQNAAVNSNADISNEECEDDYEGIEMEAQMSSVSKGNFSQNKTENTTSPYPRALCKHCLLNWQD
jgi:hypothetical protein